MPGTRGRLGQMEGGALMADKAKLLAAAYRVAELLEASGHHHEAEDVRRVCRSNAAYQETCRRLYFDCQEQRKLNAELEAKSREAYADGFNEGRASECE
jgi:hypothetical protein